MILVTVAQTAVRELSGNSRVSGKPYHLRFQSGYAHTVDADGNRPPFPEKFEISLRDGQPPYPVGDYTLDASAVYVDRDGKLAISTRLKPVKTAPKA